jgi:hypothetical protein
MADDVQKPLAPEGQSSTPPRAASGSKERSDVVLLGPPTADGGGVHVLRARDERLETGELRNLEEGRPIRGEIVTLAPRKDNPRVCDVKESYTPPKMLAAQKAKGPAQVATKQYRENWDEIFSPPPRDADLN